MAESVRSFNLLRTLALTLALSVLSLTAPLAEEKPVQSYFERMATAFSTLNYDGTFVYAHGNKMDSLRILHAVKAGVERERIIRLDGPNLEIIREDKKITCVHDGDWDGNLNHRIPVGPFAKAFVRDFSQLSDHYTFEQLGEDRIVGRDALSISIKPVDDLRYGYQVWMDKETGLLLKSVLVHQGKVLERFQFTQLDLGKTIKDEELEAGINGDMMVHYPLLSQPDPVEPTVSAWKLEWIPTGFRMSIQGIRRNGDQSPAADTLTYSDGMSAFSIFVESIEKAPADLDEETTAQEGATVAVGRVVRFEDNKHLVTVVGEVPLTTAKRLAASVVPASAVR